MRAARLALALVALTGLVGAAVSSPDATMAGAAAGESFSALATAPAATLFVPIPPERILSARQISGGQSTDVNVRSGLGRDLPAGTQAVAVNVTVAGVTAQTYVSVCPSDLPAAACSGTSTVNPYAGRDVANFTIATLGPSARGVLESLQVYNDRGSVLVYLDLVGFYVSDDGGSTGGMDFQSTVLRRDNETIRLGAGDLGTATIDLPPPGATAVILRATAAGVTAGTFISVCPGSATKASCARSSTLNPAAGRDTSNLAIVPFTGADRTVKVYNNLGSVQVYLDIVGFHVPAGTGYRFVPLPPQRYLSKEPLGPGEYAQFVDGDSSDHIMALAANVTTSGNTATTYLSTCLAQMSPAECAATSTVNSYPGQDTAAGTVVVSSPLGNIQFSLYNNAGNTLVDMDILGFYVDTRVVIDAVAFDASGNPAFGETPSISSDGNVIAYRSGIDATVVDTLTGTTVKANTAADGSVAGYPIRGQLQLSGDGRSVAYATENLFGAGGQDILHKNLTTGALDHVNTKSDGTTLPGLGYLASISDDGRYVAFINQVVVLPGNYYRPDAYLKDVATGTLIKLNPDIATAPADDPGVDSVTISGNGRVVATCQPRRIDAATMGALIKLYDPVTGTTREILPLKSDGTPGQDCRYNWLDYSGTKMASLNQDGLVSADTDNQLDVYLRDIPSGRITLVSQGVVRAPSGSEVITDVGNPVLSGDGRRVAFTAGAAVLAWDSGTGEIRLASRGSISSGAFGDSRVNDIDRTGERIVMEGTAGLPPTGPRTDDRRAFVTTIDWPVPN